MALEFLDLPGLTTFFNKLKELFSNKDEIDRLEADTVEYVTDVDYSLIAFDTKEIVSDKITLAAPVINNDSSYYLLSWNAVPGAASYWLYSDDLSTGVTDERFGKFALNTTTGTTFSLWDLLKGRAGTFTFYVVAFNDSGFSVDFIYSDFSNSITITKLPAPNGLAIDGTTLSWNAVEGAYGYMLFVNPKGQQGRRHRIHQERSPESGSIRCHMQQHRPGRSSDSPERLRRE